jgi:hypothetical protein
MTIASLALAVLHKVTPPAVLAAIAVIAVSSAIIASPSHQTTGAERFQHTATIVR